ncbi:MAG: tetratricopeptide repeat protein, partial [Bacteroidetes bacterium]|nr:tetratricopeptide repeat protein [Bacteroidota bacterium]
MLKTIFLFALFTFCLLLPLHAQSQPESAASLFQKAEKLYYENKNEQSEKLLNQIDDEFCRSEKWVLECAETRILLAILKSSDRKFESSLSLLDRAESMVIENWGPSSDLMSKIYQTRINTFLASGKFEAGQNEMDAALKYLESYDKQYMAAARIYLSTGNLLEELGNYPEAIDYYQKSLSAVSTMKKDESALRLRSIAYNNLALSYRMSGELAKAMENYLLALDVTKQLHGEKHSEVALIYNNIGTIHYLRGDYGLAADFFSRSGDLFLESFGEEHPNVAGAYNNAAVIYIEMGNLERGSEILERAQQIKEKTLGTNHIDTAIGYSNLAHVYEQMGNHEKAQGNLQKSLQIRQQIYGDNHPSLVDVHRMTGDFYSRTGDQ